MKIPYERIVQWTAGPISIVSGYIATQLETHISLFGSLGLGQNKVAHAIVVGSTFVVSTGVTYAAHHKWLDNLAKWWTVQAAGVTPAQVAAGDDTPSVELISAHIEASDQALTELQAKPGTPAEEVTAGLTPSIVPINPVSG